MSQTNFADFEPKTSGDRTVMHILYAMHTLSWATGYLLAFVGVLINYIKRNDETDPLYSAHHSYMISTFWWTFLWAVLAIPLYLLLWIPGAAAHFVVGLWYLYRCIRGWLRFNDNRDPR